MIFFYNFVQSSTFVLKTILISFKTFLLLTVTSKTFENFVINDDFIYLNKKRRLNRTNNENDTSSTL